MQDPAPAGPVIPQIRGPFDEDLEHLRKGASMVEDHRKATLRGQVELTPKGSLLVLGWRQKPEVV
jgi:hypothetical protein